MAYLLERQTTFEVKRVVTNLQEDLSTEVFNHLFPILLTDRGTEFIDLLAIEVKVKKSNRLTLNLTEYKKKD